MSQGENSSHLLYSEINSVCLYQIYYIKLNCISIFHCICSDVCFFACQLYLPHKLRATLCSVQSSQAGMLLLSIQLYVSQAPRRKQISHSGDNKGTINETVDRHKGNQQAIAAITPRSEEKCRRRSCWNLNRVTTATAAMVCCGQIQATLWRYGRKQIKKKKYPNLIILQPSSLLM